MKKILQNREQKIIKAFAEVLLPLDKDNPEMELLVQKVEDHLLYLSKDTRVAWRMCLWIFELLAFFYYGKCRVMSRMEPEFRNRYVIAWHHTFWSLKRTLKRFLETLIFMNYYSLPKVQKRLGYVHHFKPAGGSRDFPSSNLIREFPKKDVACDADVCIIGSGAGGAFAAMALAQAGKSVVVIEEGGYFDVNDFDEDEISMTKKLYRAGGLINTFGWPPILVPVGCCVGGTTLINSGTCFRTPAKVFEHWVDRFGLATWLPERMDPYYRRVEELLEIAPAEENMQNSSAKIFAKGAASLGINIKPLVRNAPGCSGSGICCWGCPTNSKKSVQMNAIPLAMQSGAKIYTRCLAEKINFNRHHATSVEARFRDPVNKTYGPKLSVKARVIISSCGTFNTPALFGRSRIPNPSGERGHNLTLHPASKVFAMFDEEICGWKGIPQGYFSDTLSGEGIKFEGIFLPPAFTASTILLTGKEHHSTMARYKNLAVFGMMVSDTTRGRVVRGFGGRPLLIYNINREDLPKYQRGIAYLAEAFFAAGATKVFPSIHTLPVLTRSDGAKAITKLKLRNKDLDLQAFHPLGTCRMGADPREAVVDSNARVYGLDNLFVADGSIFPTSLGVNPQMTIMAAALKIADSINREYL